MLTRVLISSSVKGLPTSFLPLLCAAIFAELISFPEPLHPSRVVRLPIAGEPGPPPVNAFVGQDPERSAFPVRQSAHNMSTLFVVIRCARCARSAGGARNSAGLVSSAAAEQRRDRGELAERPVAAAGLELKDRAWPHREAVAAAAVVVVLVVAVVVAAWRVASVACAG